ncbi:hypothetical protein [Pseudoxanthomonas sp. UC19_8]|uniref:hypothetical protein n=1 Tax=Pseudoxanthomonas sp. UC19_8 TaxID=3350175 RepID=UPI0036D2B651
MKLIASLWDRFDPDRSRIKRDLEGALTDLAGLEKNIELLRASLESVKERCQALEDLNSDCKAELDAHELRLQSIDETLLKQSGSSLSGAPSLFNILLSFFIVLVICGASAVLNHAVDQEVVDYALFNLPILAAVFAGLGLFVRKDRRIFGQAADGFFFCCSVLLLIVSVVAYGLYKDYLWEMVINSSGVCPLAVATFWLWHIRKEYDRTSVALVALVIALVAFLALAVRWSYVVSEYNPKNVWDIIFNLIQRSWFKVI